MDINSTGKIYMIISCFDRKKYTLVSGITFIVLSFLVSARFISTFFFGASFTDIIFYDVQNTCYAIIIFSLILFISNKYIQNKKYFFSNIMSTIKTNYFFIIFLFLFWLWILICTLCADDHFLAFYGNSRRSEGVPGRTSYILIFISMLLIKDKKMLLKILKSFCISSILPAIYGIFTFYSDLYTVKGFYSENFWSVATYHAVFDHFNHYGYYLCMVIMISGGLIITLKETKCRIAYALVFVLNIWILIVNDCFGSYLASCIALLIMTLLWNINILNHSCKRKNLFIPIIVFILATIIFNILNISTNHIPLGISSQGMNNTGTFSEFSNLGSDISKILSNSSNAGSAGTGRWRLWNTAAGFISNSPVTGYGEDGIAVLYKAKGFINDRPANEYIQYACFFGIPGAVLYILFLLSLFFNRIKRIKKLNNIILTAGGAVTAYAISAFFGNTTYYVTVYFFMFLGICASSNIND